MATYSSFIEDMLVLSVVDEDEPSRVVLSCSSQLMLLRQIALSCSGWASLMVLWCLSGMSLNQLIILVITS
jgi:hypothetical protein